jgi:predicted metal-dependent hydrolase
MNKQSCNKAKVINISGIGEIEWKRNHRARNLSLSVEPFTGIRVTVPPGTPLSQAKRFVISKKSWIVKHLKHAQEMERKRRQAATFIDRIDPVKAANELVGELTKLADRYGYQFRKVTVRNQKTRWGSCSTQNNISLNINLVHLPEKLLRYVLLHELVHTRIKNHGRKFWEEMDRLVGDAKDLRKKLNEFSYLLLKG